MTPAPQKPTPEPMPVEPVDEDEAALAVHEVDAVGKVLLARARSVEHADALAPALAKIAKRRNEAVLLVVGDVRLEAFDDKQMLAAGWVRAQPERAEPTAEQLARVIEP